MSRERPNPDATPNTQDRQQRCTAPHPGVSLLLSLTAFALLAAVVLVVLTLL